MEVVEIIKIRRAAKINFNSKAVGELMRKVKSKEN